MVRQNNPLKPGTTWLSNKQYLHINTTSIHMAHTCTELVFYAQHLLANLLFVMQPSRCFSFKFNKTFSLATIQKKNSPIFLLQCYSKVRNLNGFFSFGVKEGYPTMLLTLQGFLMQHRSILRLDALPNTTTELFGIRTLNFMTPLSTRPRLLLLRNCKI